MRAQTHSVLIVLQGLDTSGKDGTIKHVMESMNPQGCDVASFKVPTPEEAAHDFLWRIHKQTPGKGLMTHLQPLALRRRACDPRSPFSVERHSQSSATALINDFEKLLTDSNTIILKFFLHISKDEQKERLEDREKDEEKAWKLSTGDWEERQFWDDYTAAYEDALGATSTKHAPWFIVPADHKWFRNLAVATALVEALRPYKPVWEEALKKVGEQRKAELAEMRRTRRRKRQEAQVHREPGGDA